MSKNQQNYKPLVLQCNEYGVWEKYEPYMTIECPTEEDYNFIVKAVEHYKKSKEEKPISCGHGKGGWISVDERLPEDDLPKDTERRTIRCLVATNKGSVKACVRQRYILASTGELSPWCWSRDMFATPTHWMPLPSPPDMKGGAE